VNILLFIIYTLGIYLITRLDRYTEVVTDLNKKKDTQVMKVIHDLKNPIMSISQTIFDPDATMSSIIETCTTDLEDLQEMLENMRAEFK